MTMDRYILIYDRSDLDFLLSGFSCLFELDSSCRYLLNYYSLRDDY